MTIDNIIISLREELFNKNGGIQMERFCQYPDCEKTLSNLVPLKITLCGEHQYKLLRLRSRLAENHLSEKDIQFIFYHPQGCNVNQLAVYLDIPLSTMAGYIKKGILKAKRNRKNHLSWNISTEEIIRVIIITRSWISVCRLAREASICKSVLLSYVREGYFGSFRLNLSGAISIRKRKISDILEIFQKVKSLKLEKKKWPRKYIKRGETTPGEISRKLQTSCSTIYYWMLKGQLPFQKRGKRLIIKKDDFEVFVCQVMRGKIRVKKNFLPFLQAIYDKGGL